MLQDYGKAVNSVLQMHASIHQDHHDFLLAAVWSRDLPLIEAILRRIKMRNNPCPLYFVVVGWLVFNAAPPPPPESSSLCS